MNSIFLSNLHHAYAQTDGTYDFPNSREGDMLRQAKIEIEALRDCTSQGRAEDRCTTHHHACDCREAVHKEVAESLRIAVQSMEWVMWNRLDYTQEEIAANLESFLDALERYDEMYP